MTEKNYTGHRYTEEQIDLVMRLLVKTGNQVGLTLKALDKLAKNEKSEDMKVAQSVVEHIDGSEQLRNRCIYDIRRRHYDSYLELLLETKGLHRLTQIVTRGEENNALKAIDTIHNITKGKPVQKLELTGFVTHDAIQAAVEKEALPIDGEWVNPEDALEELPTDDG